MPDEHANAVPLSNRHMYVAPASALKMILGVALARAAGEAMVTSGPVESTDHMSVAGVSSTVLAMSIPRTENACGFWLSNRLA